MHKRVAFWVALPLAVTALVDGLAYALAAKTDSGLVSDDYYIKSLKPDPEDARRANLARLGWKAEFEAPAPGGEVVFGLHDRSSAPVANAKVSVLLFCLTAAGNDRTLALQETKPGVYTGVSKLIVPGIYEARFRIQKEGQEAAWYGRFQRRPNG